MSVSLGSAFDFAILAGTAVTNTGPTTIVGDIGIFPGTSYVDGGTITLTGSTHIEDSTAMLAQTDLATAYTEAATATPTNISNDYTTLGLDGITLVPGVY